MNITHRLEKTAFILIIFSFILPSFIGQILEILTLIILIYLTSLNYAGKKKFWVFAISSIILLFLIIYNFISLRT